MERQDAPRYPRCLTLLTKGPRVVDVWARAAFDTLAVGGGGGWGKEHVLNTQFLVSSWVRCITYQERTQCLFFVTTTSVNSSVQRWHQVCE
jgi:hypothetical protein